MSIPSVDTKQEEVMTQDTEPLRLFTPLHIPHGKSVSAVSQTPILVRESAIIWAATPIFIQPTSSYGINVELSENLGQDFATGRNNLPDELKVRILSYLLVFDHSLGERHSLLYWSAASNRLMSCLRSTPEIANLAREIFYSKNIFFLKTHDGCFPNLKYPPTAINHYIRRLEILASVRRGTWLYLKYLANGRYGFKNLQHLKLIFDLAAVYVGANPEQTWFGAPDNEWSYPYNCEGIPLRRMLDSGVTFKCKGELRFGDDFNEDVDQEELKALAEDKVHFENGKKSGK